MLRGIGSADRPHLLYVLDVVHGLNMRRIDIANSQRIQTCPINLRIVAGIEETAAKVLIEGDGVTVHWIASPRDHISKFVVDLVAEHAPSDGSAIDVLIDRGTAHQHTRKPCYIHWEQPSSLIEIAIEPS